MVKTLNCICCQNKFRVIKIFTNKGFTLIELLVVISIIGVISAMSFFALQSSRESARNARRRADLETIRSALEMYKADCNQYPAASGNAVPNPLQANPSAANCVGNSVVYLSSVPTDPNSGNYYYRRISATSYELCARLEGVSGTTACGGASCPGGACNYSVTNP
ncbi:MAG: prepilin-type N-terminal cleavage/methylation domain-containing protein [Patescibacteria group bacterium]|nr:prepilin-type N-terminal cleavage/methylation domain-containing protein [Patescibacteria group bacterium]